MLKRELSAMPDYIREGIIYKGVLEDYNNRPAYQRNDYISWISRAAKPETKQKRLDQMISELKQGGVYMKMNHPGSKKE